MDKRAKLPFSVFSTEARNFGAYLEVVIEIPVEGDATVLQSTNNYSPGSWPRFENSLLPQGVHDQTIASFPGQVPSQNNTIVINIETVRQ